MGACASRLNQAQPTTSEERQARAVSEAIDKSLDQEAKKFKKECKILLLGSGESGKTTIVKQMKIIHQGGFTFDELASYTPIIHRNLVESAQALVLASRKFNIPFQDDVKLAADIVHDFQLHPYPVFSAYPNVRSATSSPTASALGFRKDSLSTTAHGHIPSSSDHAHSPIVPSSASTPQPELVQRARALYVPPADSRDLIPTAEAPLPVAVARAIDAVWTDPIVPALMDRNNEFYIMDNASYFFQHASRIGAPGYIPNETDVLRARAKSTGVTETRFNMGGLSIHMFDVGGQRSERKKWIHCFESVTSIIFCTAISEYDQLLLEADQNRMVESLVLFESIINSRWFLRTSIILFLNKIDIFKKKIRKSPLERYFPKYIGGPDINKAAKYIIWQFMQANRAKLCVYPHLTQATDTSSTRLVFAAVRETVLKNALKDSGIL